MRVEESIEIARPLQEVWDFVADPMNDVRWCPKVKRVEAAGPGVWKVSHKPVPWRSAIELELRQVEVDEPRRMLIREEDDVSVFEVEYRLEPSGPATRFTQVSEIEWKRLPRFLYGVFERGVRRDLRVQLRELRDELADRG